MIVQWHRDNRKMIIYTNSVGNEMFSRSMKISSIFGLGIGMCSTLACEKRYGYPSYLGNIVEMYLRNSFHHYKYTSFYGDYLQLESLKDNKSDPLGQRKNNILMLNHGRFSGVPLFHDEMCNPASIKNARFLTVSQSEHENPHTKRKEEDYLELLMNLPSQYFDSIFLFIPEPESKHFEDEVRKLVPSINRILKNDGKLLMEDLTLCRKEGNLTCEAEKTWKDREFPNLPGFNMGSPIRVNLQKEQQFPDYCPEEIRNMVQYGKI